MKKLLISFFLIIFVISSHSVYSAENFTLPKSRVNPGSIIYSAKRFSENILLKFNSSKEGRLNFYKKLMVTRLSELDYVAANKKLGEVEKSSQRFAYQAGTLTDYVVSEKMDKEKEGLLQSFEQYKPILAKLRDVYPANTSYWMLLQQDIDTLNINAEKLK